MYGAMGAGMLRGWVSLWNAELSWLLAATLLAIVAGAAVEITTSIRARRR